MYHTFCYDWDVNYEEALNVSSSEHSWHKKRKGLNNRKTENCWTSHTKRNRVWLSLDTEAFPLFKSHVKDRGKKRNWRKRRIRWQDVLVSSDSKQTSNKWLTSVEHSVITYNALLNIWFPPCSSVHPPTPTHTQTDTPTHTDDLLIPNEVSERKKTRKSWKDDDICGRQVRNSRKSVSRSQQLFGFTSVRRYWNR